MPRDPMLNRALPEQSGRFPARPPARPPFHLLRAAQPPGPGPGLLEMSSRPGGRARNTAFLRSRSSDEVATWASWPRAATPRARCSPGREGPAKSAMSSLPQAQYPCLQAHGPGQPQLQPRFGPDGQEIIEDPASHPQPGRSTLKQKLRSQIVPQQVLQSGRQCRSLEGREATAVHRQRISTLSLPF